MGIENVRSIKRIFLIVLYFLCWNSLGKNFSFVNLFEILVLITLFWILIQSNQTSKLQKLISLFFISKKFFNSTQKCCPVKWKLIMKGGNKRHRECFSFKIKKNQCIWKRCNKNFFLFAIIIMCKWMTLLPGNEHTKKMLLKIRT